MKQELRDQISGNVLGAVCIAGSLALIIFCGWSWQSVFGISMLGSVFIMHANISTGGAVSEESQLSAKDDKNEKSV